MVRLSIVVVNTYGGRRIVENLNSVGFFGELYQNGWRD